MMESLEMMGRLVLLRLYKQVERKESNKLFKPLKHHLVKMKGKIKSTERLLSLESINSSRNLMKSGSNMILMNQAS